jgi:molecular chaperone GrpE
MDETTEIADEQVQTGATDDGAGDEIAALKAQLEAAHDARLRALADFANFKRRTEEEKESLRQILLADLLTRLLPVADNFDRALLAADQTREYEKLVGGVDSIRRQLEELLRREGVTPIEAVNQPFDPNLHNAVLREETSDYPENTIVEELQKGYTLGGRILRPTLVKVATRG